MTVNVNESVSIEKTEKYGRILQARKPFKRGDLVVIETPLVISADSLTDKEEKVLYEAQVKEGLDMADDFLFIKGFCAITSKDLIDQVFDCYFPADSEWRASSHMTKVVRVVPYVKRFKWSNKYTSVQLEQVILIKTTNAHSFNQQGGSALFALGSKIRHSCNPNVVYTSQRIDSKGCFVVIRPINPNEEIIFSYIDTFVSTPIRQRKLKQQYLFECDCERCITGVDTLRGFSCDCSGTRWFSQTEKLWECDCCGSSDVPEAIDQELVHGEEISTLADSCVDVKMLETETRKFLLIFGPKHSLVKILQKRLLDLKIDQCFDDHIGSGQSIFDPLEVTELAQGILSWAGNDPGVLDSILLRLGCALGRKRKFQDAMNFLQLLSIDQDIVLNEESSNRSLTRRALAACRIKRLEDVPDLAPLYSTRDNDRGCPVQ